MLAKIYIPKFFIMDLNYLPKFTWPQEYIYDYNLRVLGQLYKRKVKVKVLSCVRLTLYDPMDSSLPGSSIHGILSFLSLTVFRTNELRISYASGNALVLWVVNQFAFGGETWFVGILGMYILIFTSTWSCNISIVRTFIHKIRIWGQYQLCSLQDLGLYVHWVKSQHNLPRKMSL